MNLLCFSEPEVIWFVVKTQMALELWANDQTKNIMIELVNISKKVPSEREISDLEIRLSAMKKQREEAKKRAVQTIQSVIEELPENIAVDDMLKITNAISQRLKSTHKKVRGNPVPSSLKNNLEAALKLGNYSLAQLERLFGVSISYISRVKRDLGLTKPHHHHHPMQLAS